MYLHIGSDCMIHSDDIIAIFDFENTTTSKITREFLSGTEKENFVISVSEEDLPKSFIVTDYLGESKVYISPISSSTLLKRLSSMSTEGNIWKPKK